MERNDFGVWQITVMAKNGKCAIQHNSKFKVTFQLPNGERINRISAWITRFTQDLEVSPVYDGK
jgi:1,4-alpha-glucan branching enzyme